MPLPKETAHAIDYKQQVVDIPEQTTRTQVNTLRQRRKPDTNFLTEAR